jgi:TolA-binding protein
MIKLLKYNFTLLILLKSISVCAQQFLQQQVGLQHLYNSQNVLLHSNQEWAPYLLQKSFVNPTIPNYYLTDNNIYNTLNYEYLAKKAKVLNASWLNEYLTINNATGLDINFHLGQTYFGANQYLDAISAYKNTDATFLTNKQVIRKNFNLAYSYLRTKQDSKVAPLFASLINIEGNYFKSGNYYYGLLKYYNKDYEAAKASFNQIIRDRFYAKVLPFYLAEIEYNLNNKAEALNIAKKYLSDNNSPNIFNKGELNLLASQILVEQSKYQEALPYLKNYISVTKKIRNEDLFQYGYLSYKTNDYETAIKVLEKINTEDDSLNLISNYVQGESYLALNKKPEAKATFAQGANTPIINNINEACRFYNAKLSYELQQDDDALNSAYNLFRNYPLSTYKSEMLKIITSILEYTTNYKAALNIINQIKNEPIAKASHQRILYNYALEQINGNSNNYNEIENLLNESISNNTSQEVATKALFWLSEIAYRKKDYNSAIILANQFLKDPSPNDGVLSDNSAQLLKAYSYMKLGNIAQATECIDKIIAHNDASFLSINKASLEVFKNTLAQLKIKENNLNNYLAQLELLEKSEPTVLINNLDSLVKVNVITPIQENKIALAYTNAYYNLGNLQQANIYAQQIKKWNNPKANYMVVKILADKKDTLSAIETAKQYYNLKQEPKQEPFVSEAALIIAQLLFTTTQQDATEWALYAKKAAVTEPARIAADKLLKEIIEKIKPTLNLTTPK